MKKFKLKPYLFCGNTAVALQDVGEYEDGQPIWYRGFCQHCTARSQIDGTEEGAAGKWNERSGRSGSSDSSEDEAQNHVEAIQNTIKMVKESKADIMRLIDLKNIRTASIALSHCILDRKNCTSLPDIISDEDRMQEQYERFADDPKLSQCTLRVMGQVMDIFFTPPSIGIDANAWSQESDDNNPDT